MSFDTWALRNDVGAHDATLQRYAETTARMFVTPKASMRLVETLVLFAALLIGRLLHCFARSIGRRSFFAAAPRSVVIAFTSCGEARVNASNIALN
jgi:hypothetical protein